MTYFHHIGLIPDEFTLPAGRTAPRQTVLDLLATYVADAEVAVPSGALVALLADFDVTGVAARGAITRLARRGLLVAHRSGRNTAYAISPEALAGIAQMDETVWSFGRTERDWDGLWTIVVFTLNDETRLRAHRVRNTLRWLGFGPLRDGVWISPHADPALSAANLSEGTIGKVVVFRAERLVGDVDLRQAFPVDEIAAQYGEFIERCRALRYQARSGDLSGREALRSRTELTSLWRRFPVIDPDLPVTLLPPNWPRRRARELFGTTIDALAGPSKRHVDHLVGAPVLHGRAGEYALTS